MKQVFFVLFTLLLFQNCKNDPEKKDVIQESMILNKDTLKVLEDTIKSTQDPLFEMESKVASPISPVDYDTTTWTELTRLDPTILLDLRYATEDNFMEEQVYECGRCFLRPRVAKAVIVAHKLLQKRGLGLKMYDCYRPRPIQWKLWNKVPNPKYVADPKKGSMHNRGSAVDLTIVDENGEELAMGTDYDYFGKEGWTFYKDLPKEVLENRKLLRETLGKFGLKHIKTEWWHFAYRNKRYRISDFVWECY